MFRSKKQSTLLQTSNVGVMVFCCHDFVVLDVMPGVMIGGSISGVFSTRNCRDNPNWVGIMNLSFY